MALGYVLEADETAFRCLPEPIRRGDRDVAIRRAGYGARDRPASVSSLSNGIVISLWWDGVVGLDLNWTTRRVVLDYGDGEPRSLSEPYVAGLAVAATACTYGIAALTTHPALKQLHANH